MKMESRTRQPDIFLTGLTLLFIGLKLTGNINWSWWAVLSPIWVPIVIALVFGAFFLLIYLINK